VEKLGTMGTVNTISSPDRYLRFDGSSNYRSFEWLEEHGLNVDVALSLILKKITKYVMFAKKKCKKEK
jgi:hypothetical protein